MNKNDVMVAVANTFTQLIKTTGVLIGIALICCPAVLFVPFAKTN